MIQDLSGVWQCEIQGQSAPMRLPGTLDEAGIGFQDDSAHQWKVDEVRAMGFYQDGDPIVTRLTRKHTYEGLARITRQVAWRMPSAERVFVECQRARQLRLMVNGTEAPLHWEACLNTPYVFEVTGLVTGKDTFAFLSDNSYPGWPHDAIVYSSAASDETQTNWNGLLGYVRIRTEKPDFIAGVRVYPNGDSVDVCVEMDLKQDWEGQLFLRSDALLGGEARAREQVKAGRREIWYTGLPLREDVKHWDLEEGNLYTMTVTAEGMESRTVTFGVRDFEARDGHLLLNGRRFFLRGETNCAVFPETGYPPMTVPAWKEVLEAYRRYGVNCMRFHSHCPPEAAFAAADEMGMLMQPELSHWNPVDAFAAPEAKAYYRTELRETLRWLANHPSFVMLTFGNELQSDASGHTFMNELLAEARGWDATRLYANGSNPHYGALGADPHSDFYTATDLPGHHLRATSAEFRGWLNQGPIDACRQYDDGVQALRAATDQPVFSFEVGQYEVLPDFDEIQDYHGVTDPANLRFIQKKMIAAGLQDEWKKRVEASGELSLLGYRAEVEAALRTEGYSGISLLGLQDFPGQGTALVGMMNAHLRPKPFDFARPERFRAFFRDTLPLPLLPKFTFTAGDPLNIPVRLAHYGKQDLRGKCAWTLQGDGISIAGTLPVREVKRGGLTDLGTVETCMPDVDQAARLTLTVRFCGQKNAYSLWVYPDEALPCPPDVYEARYLDERALRTLAAGGKVYLSPPSTPEALPHSIQAQFPTDFWSVCTFGNQAGGMGQMIDAAHPLFRHFPTEGHTDWQWWPMARQRAVIVPKGTRAIVTELDSYAYLRPMAQLLECRCGGGRLLFSSMGLQNLLAYPEARALQNAIYRYLASDAFAPIQEMSVEMIRGLVAING